MSTLVRAFLMLLMTYFRTRASLQIENAMLRHQLNVYQRRQSRPRLRPMDRFLWAWISRVWPGWQETLMLVRLATVITWRRKRFRDYWAALSQHRGPGRPPAAKEVQELIRKLSGANIGWGVPRLIGELRNSGLAHLRAGRGDEAIQGLEAARKAAGELSLRGLLEPNAIQGQHRNTRTRGMRAALGMGGTNPRA